MNRHFVLVVAFCFCILPGRVLSSSWQTETVNFESYVEAPDENSNEISIIPQPEKMIISPGKLNLHTLTGIIADSVLQHETDVIRIVLKETLGFDLSYVRSASTQNATVITLHLDQGFGLGKEGYMLTIHEGGITVSGETPTGVFYGIQSLKQILRTRDIQHDVISFLTIQDKPRYEWRGIMLDESRHFFGSAEVKKILDMMALYKLNRFQWHLTDEPAWRIEIKQYPKLTQIGSAGTWEDSSTAPQFYTQDEIRDIIAYASERHITVVPEIDMPGHATAANRAYPEFSGGGNSEHPEFTFHPVKQSTFQFLSNILHETSTLFPSDWIHTGGDEVHFGNDRWAEDPEIKNFMKNENVQNALDVQFFFERRIEQSLAEMGKINICWDEMADANLNKQNSIIMWWRHDKPQQLQKALQKGLRVILTPRIPCYFDFVQDSAGITGRRWQGKFCDIASVYFGPQIADTIIANHEKQILGVQGNIWTEYIQNQKRLEYMTFPRLLALAENAWTRPSNKNLYDFTLRLHSRLTDLDRSGIYYYNLFNPAASPEPIGVSKKK